MINTEFDCILVGILADKQDLELDYNRVAFVNGQQEIQFSMKVISKTPEGIQKDKLATCYANKFKDFGWEDDYYDDRYTRANKFESFLKDKVVLFRPTIRDSKGITYIYAEPITILPKPQNITRDSFLIPIIRLLGEQFNGYEKRLLKKEPIAPFKNYPWGMPKDSPIYVYVGRYMYSGFTEQAERLKKWVFEHDGSLTRVICDLSAWDEVLLFEEVAFIDQKVYKENIVTLLEEEGELINETAMEDSSHIELQNEFSCNNNKMGEIKSIEDSIQEIAFTGDEESQLSDRDDEILFLEHLKALCRVQGLYYDEEDLLNLHIAFKTGSLVILAGMSGTGKSRLVRVYAEALGLGVNQGPSGKFKFIPVRPTWADDTDLLGFIDMANHLYRPGETELINLLLEAEKNPDDIYLVCFDEMNLARVEHYFAKFLSVLELPSGERTLQLYNSDISSKIYNSYQYKANITIGPNVLFAGTVNIDETTYMFSDKVLDRSNVLKLKVLPFKSSSEYELEVGSLNKDHLYGQRFLQWVKRPNKGYSLSPHELGFFDELREVIQKADANKGISYRCLRQIEMYLLNVPRVEQGPLITRAKAIDLQLKQKVLPLLRGPQQQLEKLIGKYNEDTEETDNSELSRIFDDYSNISDFNRSKEEIKQKARELRWYGYVSQ